VLEEQAESTVKLGPVKSNANEILLANIALQEPSNSYPANKSIPELDSITPHDAQFTA